MDAFAQAPPGPWDIPAKAPSFFMDSQQIIKVPYTSSVKVNYITRVWRRKGSCNCFLEIFADEEHFIRRAATFAWEWGENLAKTALVPAM